jgi:hypothetical protein
MSILAVALVGVLVVFSVVFGVRSDKDIEKLLDEPGVIEKFNKSAGNKTTRGTSQISPLVQQAGKFALYLNPPKPKAPRPQKGRTTSVKRAPSATPKFTVMATSYNKSRPEMSMALIDEPGKGRNWFRQSSTVGHLLIQEVKDGVVVVKDNSGTFELKAEEKPHISLLEGAPAVKGAPAVPLRRGGISSGTARERARAVSRPSVATSVKSSTTNSGKTGSRVVKPSRPPLTRKTNEKDPSVMEEVTVKFAQLRKKLESGSFTDQERATMMNDILEEVKVLRSEDITKQDAERLNIMGKELKKKMEEPTSSSQK